MKYIAIALILISSIDLNAQWTKTNGPYGGDIFALAKSGNKIFAGTWNSGVHVSTNQGASWQNSVLNNDIRSLFADGDTVLAGTYNSGIYKSTNGGLNFYQTSLNNKYVISFTKTGSYIFAATASSTPTGFGIYVSTNGGNNWSQTSLNNKPMASIASIGSNIIAGTSLEGIFLSTDYGSSWNNVVSGNITIYALTVYNNKVFASNYYGGILISTNNGLNWIQTSLTNKSVRAFASSLGELYAGTFVNGVYKSTDGGYNWVQTNMTNKSFTSMTYSGGKLYAGGSQRIGIYMTTNGGDNWEQSPFKEFRINALSSGDSSIVCATYENGIYTSRNEGNEWSHTFINESTAEITLAFASYSNYFFTGCSGYYGFRGSSNYGNSWDMYNLSGAYGVQSVHFSNNIIYAGTVGNGVMKSTNFGINWQQTSLDNDDIYAITSIGSTVFAGSMYYGVLKSTNNGLNWVQTSLSNRYILSLISNGNTIYAGVSDSGIYKSTNAGTNWVRSGLENNNVYTFAINGANIFAGTEANGVYLSTNEGANWIQKNQGFETGNIAVTSLAIKGNYLYAGLSGNKEGVWKRSLAEIIRVTSLSTEVPDKYKLFQNYPNPFNPSTNIKYQITSHGGSSTNVKLIIFDILGKEVTTLVNENQGAGTYEVTFDGSYLPSGVYFYQLKTDNVLLTKKLILIK